MGEPNRIVTISDVAREAKVSTATVSHVLNKTRYVSEDLTRQVNEAVKRLGYYPNQLVGGLRKKKSFTIGLILPSISNETLGGLAEQIQGILFRHGYNLIICNTSYDVALENQALDTLIMKKADAIIAIPACAVSEKLLEIDRLGIPIVLVDRSVAGLHVDSVVVDNQYGAKKAMEHLLRLGHREIGYIDRKTIQSHSIDQRQGYLQALRDCGAVIKEQYIVAADGYDYEAGYRAAAHLLQKNSSITALFGYYDVVAFGAMRAAHDLGRRIPDDLSVVGYDDMPFTKAAFPRLTTVHFPVTELAQKACELVILRVKQKENRTETHAAEIQTCVIKPQLVIGESTAAPCGI